MTPAALLVILAVFLVQTTESRVLLTNAEGGEAPVRHIEPRSSLSDFVRSSRSDVVKRLAKGQGVRKVRAPELWEPLTPEFLTYKVKRDGFLSAFWMIISRAVKVVWTAGWTVFLVPFKLLFASVAKLEWALMN